MYNLKENIIAYSKTINKMLSGPGWLSPLSAQLLPCFIIPTGWTEQPEGFSCIAFWTVVLGLSVMCSLGCLWDVLLLCVGYSWSRGFLARLPSAYCLILCIVSAVAWLDFFPLREYLLCGPFPFVLVTSRVACHLYRVDFHVRMEFCKVLLDWIWWWWWWWWACPLTSLFMCPLSNWSQVLSRSL